MSAMTDEQCYILYSYVSTEKQKLQQIEIDFTRELARGGAVYIDRINHKEQPNETLEE